MDAMVVSRMLSHSSSRYSQSRLISAFGRAAPAVRMIMPMPRGICSSVVTSFSRRRSAAEVILREMPPPRGEFGISTEKRPAREMKVVSAAPLVPRSSLTTWTSRICRRRITSWIL